MGFYYAMTVFDTPFGLYYVVLFFVAWWGYGVGYLFSVLLEANNALLGGLCVTLIFGGIINGINPTVASADGNALMTGLQYLSYTRCGGVRYSVQRWRNALADDVHGVPGAGCTAKRSRPRTFALC